MGGGKGERTGPLAPEKGLLSQESTSVQPAEPTGQEGKEKVPKKKLSVVASRGPNNRERGAVSGTRDSELREEIKKRVRGGKGPLSALD